MTTTQLLVIGGGPGGYAAAIRAGQHDLDVTLVERDALGGTCLNYGCIPSKAMLTATGVVAEAENASAMGIYAEPYVDPGEMTDWKDEVVDGLTGGVESLCAANGVRVVDGTARFAGESSAEVRHADGETETVEFESAIVATGSRPIEVPGFSFDDDPILDSRQALALDSVPGRLLVVGAGYIGMELSTVFARLGADVTVVEMLDAPMPGYDADLVAPVMERADALGIDFEFGQAASEWRRSGGGVTVVTEDEDGATTEFDADQVLVAVGREPVTDTVDPEAAGLEPDENGFLETDAQARTDVDGVFAVGDVAGEPMLAHKASREGVVAAQVAAGEDAALDHRAVPAVVFTDPEIATVGLGPDDAEDAGHDPLVGRFPFAASGRAMSTDHTDGFVRIVADGDDGRVLGGQVVGPEASELIAEIGLAVEVGATVEDVAETIHAHPTLAEATMEAAEHALGHAIHTTNR